MKDRKMGINILKDTDNTFTFLRLNKTWKRAKRTFLIVLLLKIV